MNKDKAPAIITPPVATLPLPGVTYQAIISAADMCGPVKTQSVYRNLVFRGLLPSDYPEASGLNLVRDMLATLARAGLVRRVRQRPALWIVKKQRKARVYDCIK